LASLKSVGLQSEKNQDSGFLTKNENIIQIFNPKPNTSLTNALSEGRSDRDQICACINTISIRYAVIFRLHDSILNAVHSPL
jgi:hypothetical protein